MIKTIQTVLVATLSTCFAMPTVAAECPRERSKYSLVLSDDETTVVFSQEQASKGLSPHWRVRFDVNRQEKTVWSLDGFIGCFDFSPSCFLALERKPEFKKDPDAEAKTEEEKFCFEQAIVVVPIGEGDESQYLAFGGVTLLSMACGKYFDFKVKSKDDLRDEERDGTFVLPDYVKFEGCRP